MPLYQSIKTQKIVKMSLTAYDYLGKKDQAEFKEFERVAVKIPDVLKPKIEVKEVKKRGRNAKV